MKKLLELIQYLRIQDTVYVNATVGDNATL